MAGEVAAGDLPRRSAVEAETRPTLYDLAPNQCHWPLWGWEAGIPIEEKLYCGAPAIRGCYCEEHDQQLWQPRQRR